MASFVAPGVLSSDELRLLLRPNQFGSDPEEFCQRANRCPTLVNDGTNQVDGARGSRCLAIDRPIKGQTTSCLSVDLV